MLEVNKILNEDCLKGLRKLPAKCVDCVVTSPPYFGLRDYGLEPLIWGGDEKCDHKFFINALPPRRRSKSDIKDINSLQFKSATMAAAAFDAVGSNFCIKCNAWRGSYGLEQTPELYVEHTVMIFREVKRVLADHGTIWINLGDSYAGSWGSMSYAGGNIAARRFGGNGKKIERPVTSRLSNGLKPKDLIGLPWMIAFALRDDGWRLRQDIIWNKKSAMPESVTDRCTKSHEYIFLLAKSQKYFYDADAIKTEVKSETDYKTPDGWDTEKGTHGSFHRKGREKGFKGYKHRGNRDQKITGHSGNYDKNGILISKMANKRSVWTVATKPYKEAHFATFPPDLIVDCIKAGCPEWVCKKCGSPKIPISDKELVPTKKAAKTFIVDERDNLADKNDQGSNRQKDGHKPGYIYQYSNRRLEPTCKCNAGFRPGITLDPFMGAGTTAVVARKLNRNFIGFELNLEYIEMSEKRLYKELGMYL